MKPRTLPGILAGRARATPSAPAYCIKRGDTWEPVTWADFERGVEAVARALAAHDIARGDRIGIIGPTCIEWEYLQMGALRIGAVAVGIDPHYRDETLRDLLHTLDLAALGVKDADTLIRVPADVLSSLKLVASFEAPLAAEVPSISLPDVVSGRHSAQNRPPLLPGPDSDDPAITVFSSGTTGTPKPITYRHEQVAHAIEAITASFPDIGCGSHFACWLPLANLFQRIINFCAIDLGATSYIVSDPRALMQELRGISPAILIGVPRFYERLHSGISAQLAALPGFGGAVARWALALARRQALHTATAVDRASTWLADALVYRRIRSMLGPNLRYLISGSAPMPRWLLRWYDALGLPVYEAYGVSEDIVPIAMNRPGARRLGTVGKPLPVNEVRLAKDGEILVRGPGVHDDGLVASNRPGADDEARYWPTGDLGRFDADGFLSVTGRKADVFKSAGGRWIVPQPIEAALRTVPYVDHIVAVGAGRPGVIAIASLDWEALCTYAAARGVEVSPSGERQLTEHGRHLLREDFVAAAAAFTDSERPRAVILVGHAFSIEGGELTTNLKLRRQAIEARFRQHIEDAYSELATGSSQRTEAARERPLILSYP